ncbi:MAG TPA: beta-ketoacyl synthase N-terminal-like domain-containing protein [Ferruginibacter sp.]|nr:beta-ketoacyl synthase N-terminal-like domain-containing protein [Ferruginibacter sp.]
MTDIFISSDNILSPLGSTSAENFEQLKRSVSGIKRHEDIIMSEQPFYASLFDREEKFIDDAANRYTKFEKLLIASISDALAGSGVSARDKKTVLIISSTKGNISLLETETCNSDLQARISLHTSAKLIAGHFGFVSQPIIISNACISGILAMITGMRLIRSGQYENAVIAGADVISKFVLSGFQSFQAVSNELCKPFDAKRNGINLGEGAATVILSSNAAYSRGIKITGGSVSNDANHISGPSRTGEELNQAIGNAMKEAGLSSTEIDLISAHGTATVYNDEMEAKAITMANMRTVPVNSLKAYYGHTLGAAGLIESIISFHSMKEDIVLPTLGFSEMGVTMPVNIATSLYKTPLKNCLKTASGFGGCNAAVIFSKQ